jgi:hypothetical protein
MKHLYNKLDLLYNECNKTICCFGLKCNNPKCHYQIHDKINYQKNLQSIITNIEYDIINYKNNFDKIDKDIIFYEQIIEKYNNYVNSLQEQIDNDGFIIDTLNKQIIELKKDNLLLEQCKVQYILLDEKMSDNFNYINNLIEQIKIKDKEIYKLKRSNDNKQRIIDYHQREESDSKKRKL